MQTLYTKAMLLALLLALALPRSEPVLAPGAEGRWIAFELTAGNHIRFDMTVDGTPARAILDTGVTDSFVTADFARRAGIRARRQEKASAIGGQVALGWADRATLRMGALSRADAPLAITGAPGIARFGADVFIGSDMIACCALDIDYDARRFRILPSGRMPFTGAVVPLDRAGSGLLRSELMLGERRVRPVIVDTGDGSSVTLGRPAWDAARYRGPVTTTLGWGMGGTSITDTAIVPGLSLAGTALAEAEVRVEPQAGFTARAGAAGRIGSGLLLRFRVLLDPRAGHMVLRPGARFTEPVVRSTSGLLMGYVPGRLRVVHVMRGSPAAETGWRADDEICASEGAPVTGTQLPEWGAGAPGRTVRITLCDGRVRELTLRRFY